MNKISKLLLTPSVLFICSLLTPTSFYLSNYFFIQTGIFLSGLAALGLSRQFKNKKLSIALIVMTILTPLISDAVFESRYNAQFSDFETAIGSISGLDNRALTIGSKYWVSYQYDAFGIAYQSLQPISKKKYFEARFNCPIEIDFLKSSPNVSRVSSHWNPERLNINDCW